MMGRLLHETKRFCTFVFVYLSLCIFLFVFVLGFAGCYMRLRAFVHNQKSRRSDCPKSSIQSEKKYVERLQKGSDVDLGIFGDGSAVVVL